MRQDSVGRATLRSVLDGAKSRHTATAAIALGALTPILVAAALTADDRVVDPLVPILVAGAAVSNVIDVRFAGRIWLSGSFLCCLMAVAVLGPSAGVVVAIGSELAAWTWCRFPMVPLAANALGAVAPTWVAGLILVALESVIGTSGAQFDVTLGIVTCFAVATNVLIVSSLMTFHDGTSLRGLLVVYRKLLPFLLANVVLLVAITETYREVGIGAAISLIVVVLLFTYVVRLFVDARDRANQVEELSTNRGRLVAEAVSAEEQARRVLAEQLHDGPLQSLLAARQDLEEAANGNQASLSRAEATVRTTVTSLRHAVFELHPTVLEHAGLGAALSAIAEAKGQQAGFVSQVSVDPDLSGVNDQLLFSLGRELIANVAKHANAENVWVGLTRREEDLELTVRDDGQGFDPGEAREAVAAGHIGLASAAERAAAVGGHLDVTTTPGDGTTVAITIPICGALEASVDRQSRFTRAARDA